MEEVELGPRVAACAEDEDLGFGPLFNAMVVFTYQYVEESREQST